MRAFSIARHSSMAAALVVAGLVSPASAQTYPAQNITFQVGFAAGGIADLIARLVGQKLSERLGQNVVVENRGGAGGNLAAKSVSGAAPDGYTVLATTTGLAVNETASKNKGFSVDDLRTVAIVAFSPDVLAVHPSNPAKDLKEFMKNAKDKSFAYGSAGVGTGPHIGAEYFFREVAKVQGRACAVHRRRPGGRVRHRQPCRCDRADVADGRATYHAGASPRYRSCEHDAQFRGAGRADLWRDGLPERLFRLLGRLFRAGEDARCDRRQAQRRDQCDHAGRRKRSRSSRPSASTP